MCSARLTDSTASTRAWIPKLSDESSSEKFLPNTALLKIYVSNCTYDAFLVFEFDSHCLETKNNMRTYEQISALISTVFSDEKKKRAAVSGGCFVMEYLQMETPIQNIWPNNHREVWIVCKKFSECRLPRTLEPKTGGLWKLRQNPRNTSAITMSKYFRTSGVRFYHLWACAVLGFPIPHKPLVFQLYR